MFRIIQNFLPVLLLLYVFSTVAAAAENKEIDSITVLTDPHLAASLSELASLFTRSSSISVANVFGTSTDQEKKIEDGDTGDIFITSTPELIQQLKIKGLVDIYSIGPIASINGTHYTAAVVASENMTPARSFLEFMKSREGKMIFRKNGMTTP